MSSTEHEITWFTAGGLAGHPIAQAELVLIFAAVGGLLIVGLSYRFALIRLGPGRRLGLGLIRWAMWCALLALLAAPMRIQRSFNPPPEPRALAVLVDRSASMTAADNRDQRRLDDALHVWQRLKPTGNGPVLPVKTFAFAKGLASTTSVDATAALPDGQTDLFDSLGTVLKQAPKGGWTGLVTLTDGLDNSRTDPSAGYQSVVQAALGQHTPLYFIVGHNRSLAAPFLHLLTFTVPAETAPHTRVRLQAVFESFQIGPQSIGVTFAVNGMPQPAQLLQIDPGRHLETWTADYQAEDAGTLRWEIAARNLSARAETRVTNPDRGQRILYYQGSLDWGYRFLGSMLQRDDRFSLTPVFDFPEAGIALPPGALDRPPFTEKGLNPFAVVILSNVLPHQITPAQQAALDTWVKGGGILLFLTPDDAAARAVASSELEQFLPVTFASDAAPPVPANNRLPPEAAAQRVPLKPFVWNDPKWAEAIFGAAAEASVADQTPLFLNFARIERAKPGAEILARHPTELGPDGQGRILLALQRYGGGKSVVFSTDALWRWKMSQPSQSRGTELFWENLFSWLIHDRASGIYFDHPPVVAGLGQEITLELGGLAPEESVAVKAVSPDHRESLIPLPGGPGSRTLHWRPATAGRWQVTARQGGGPAAHAWITIETPHPETGELSDAAPNEDLLRRIADATGGAVLTQVAPPAWTPARPSATLTVERREPLWHHSWIFALLLGLYSLDLLLRRRWNLL
jgi:hypothetical protein